MPKGVYVRNVGPVGDRFWPHVAKSAGCWEWTGSRHRNGYGQFYYRGPAMAHRVSWELANGPVPDGMLVCHRCDNPPCVRPDHLFLGTQADNLVDMVSKGRHWTAHHPERLSRGDAHWTRNRPGYKPAITREQLVRGERHPAAKLTADDVREIRRLRSEGMPILTLSKAFGVKRPSIKRILNGTGWAHVV